VHVALELRHWEGRTALSTCINILTESDLDRLADATLSVLERAGVMYQSDEVLDALEGAGAAIDRATRRALLPRRLVKEIVERQRAAAGPVGPPPERREPGPGDGPLPGIHNQVAQFYYDHESGRRRAANRADFIRMVQFGDALDERRAVDQVLLMREEPPLVEPLESLAVILEHTSRPGSIYPHFASQFPYLEETGEICAGDPHRFLTGGIFMVSPLRMDQRACDYMAAMVGRGLHCAVGTQPVSGLSAPVTRAGAIVVGTAEILAGWAASTALNPEIGPLRGSICSGSVDMATGNVTFCSPESMIQDIGCIELFRRRFGGHVGIAGGSDYTSAKFPGYQAGFEKAFEAMAASAYTGGHPRLGAGLLDLGKMFSPLQLLIDRELQGFLWRFSAGARVDDDEIALELVLSIGSGMGASYLDSAHTLTHYRRSLWFPGLVDRQVWQDDREEEHPYDRLLTRSRAQFDAVMARYTPPDVDRDMLAKVKAVIARARRELL
jgi:trimethylamine:corrinoid methyltransferase-like protein